VTESLLIRGLPVEMHRLHTSRAAARAAPLGEIELACDPAVPGLWVNRRFDPSRVRYDGAYDNALQHGEAFVAFADALAKRLARRYRLDRGLATEVGAGDGWFCDRLRAHGAQRIETFDPKETGDAAPRARDDRRLIVARHVIEHVPDPIVWLRAMASCLTENGALYVEAPSGEAMAAAPSGVGVLDCIYEHRSYFTVASMVECARRAGLRVTDGGRAFNGQHAWIEAGAAPVGAMPQLPAAAGAGPDLARFCEAARLWIAALPEHIAALAAEGPVALWGAGSKGKALLNLASGGSRVARVYDANPRKWGSFVGGTGHEVRPPAEIVRDRPAFVLATNPAYREEIERAVSAMAPRPSVIVVGWDAWPGASHR